MTDRRTDMPVETDDVREEAAGGAAGYRGERAQDRSTDDPELRREVDTVNGPVEVEDSSGSQHVEAERAAARRAKAGSPSSTPRRPRRNSGVSAPGSSPPEVASSTNEKTWWSGIIGVAVALTAGAAAYGAQRLWKRRT